MPENSPQLYWDILDQERKAILPFFQSFKDDFYLAGGTGLALQLGHRDSIDFDFFSPESFSTGELFRKIETVFADHHFIKTQEGHDTLCGTINTRIKVGFLAYHYPLVSPLIETEHFRIASIEDIGTMKLSAITGRSVLKDYVDLYFILQQVDLAHLLELTQRKLPTIDTNLILKSLVYFDDIQSEPIAFKHNDDVSFDKIKDLLNETVKKYLSHLRR